MPLVRRGKENVRPSTSGVQNDKKGFSHQEDFRSCHCLTSNDDRKKETDSKRTIHPVSESFPAKKTPFHIHYDERNVVEDTKRFKSSMIISGGHAGKRKEEYMAGRTQTISVDETKEKMLLPSRIPRQFRSCACAPNTGSQGQTSRSASAELKTIRPEERSCKAADLKFGWSGVRAVTEQLKVKSCAEEARGLIKKPIGDAMSSKKSIRVPLTTKPVEMRKSNVIDKHSSKPINSSTLTVQIARISRTQTTSNILRPTRNSSITSNIDRIGSRAIDRVKDSLLLQKTRSRTYNTTLRSKSNTETPVEDNTPQTITLQETIRKTVNVQQTQDVEETDSCQNYDYFPWQLLYHSDYHDDLPTTEYDRERRSPKLSKSFLKKNINVEQRRLIVIFILRLGMHCHYPSFVIYQAVKLFDAAMDRIPVKIPYIQLVALACLWIALKKHQNFHKIPTATTMVDLAGDLYIDHQDLIIKYEQEILLTLNFNITFADPFALFTHYLISCRDHITLSEDATTFIYYVGGYLIDITLLDESFCRLSSCLIALSIMELALGLTIDTVVVSARPRWLFWRGLLFTASPTVNCRFTDQALDQIRVMILNRVMTSAGDHSGFNVVYKKYARSRFGRISTTLLERVSRISPSEIFMS